MATVIISNSTPVFTRNIEKASFPNVEINQVKRGVNINSMLPFRIRFTAIQVPAAIGNVPAIPFQVIGFSNYIL